ncbi:MAG: alpha/beta fold hydrolase [Hydrogenophaga sp.]|jgi:pimeloyl-ACP methyl ester carboxylesterase|nr:alpha/beta fold hydrolase [Hydrogenophaga sp.]
MPQPQCKYLPVGGPAARGAAERRMAYWEWSSGPALDSRQVVICVHGLSRQGRDFDALATALSAHARVLCVDVAGRGQSDWLEDPTAYHVGTYAADLAALVRAVRADTPDAVIDWVGTSMGGLIGMAVAAQPAMGLRRLVLNDVGPVIQYEALQRIGTYLGLNPSFASEQEAIDYLASISTGFGPHTSGQWQALSRPMLRERDGRWGLHYDPAIAVPFRALTSGPDPVAARQAVQQGEAALWGLYDAIASPTLLLRGADSDLLTRDTAAEMGRRGPRAACVEFAGVGHAPTLVAADQIAAVQAFLGGA